jgi:hypothetical protein
MAESLRKDTEALKAQAPLLLKNPDPILLNIYITKEIIPAIQRDKNKELEPLPKDIFECLRLTLTINT